MDHFGYLCLVFVMLSRLFIAALWSPTGKGLVSWLLFEVFYCVFVTFPCGILGQVWYLIISTTDLCLPFLFFISIKAFVHCCYLYLNRGWLGDNCKVQ